MSAARFRVGKQASRIAGAAREGAAARQSGADLVHCEGDEFRGGDRQHGKHPGGHPDLHHVRAPLHHLHRRRAQGYPFTLRASPQGVAPALAGDTHLLGLLSLVEL